MKTTKAQRTQRKEPQSLRLQRKERRDLRGKDSMSDDGAYDESSIKPLDPMEHVRRRPGMYIGGTDIRALHQMVWTIVDELYFPMKLHDAPELKVTLFDENKIVVADNGEGLSVKEGHIWGYNELEIILSKVGTGGLLHDWRYTASTIGIPTINALSYEFEAVVKRGGYVWRQLYKAGQRQTEVEKVRPLENGENTGTAITFTPDYTILDDNPFDYAMLHNRLREIAFLVPNLTMKLEDKRTGQERSDVFHYPDGIKAYVKYLNRDYMPLHDVIYMKKTVPYEDYLSGVAIDVEIAIQYVDEAQSIVLGFVNEFFVAKGGAYEDELLQTLNRVFRKSTALPDRVQRDVIYGLTVIISIQHPDPRFGGSMPYELINPEVAGIVGSTISNHIEKLEQESSEVLDVIAGRYLVHKRVRDERRFG